MPISSSNFLADFISLDFMESILKYRTIITMPKTGILACEPKGIWYVAKGIFSSKSTGFITMHIITKSDRIMSHKLSLISTWQISNRYIASNDTEHANVMMKTVLGRKFRICFSIKYRVTIKYPSRAERQTVKQKVVLGYYRINSVVEFNIYTL